MNSVLLKLIMGRSNVYILEDVMGTFCLEFNGLQFT